MNPSESSRSPMAQTPVESSVQRGSRTDQDNLTVVTDTELPGMWAASDLSDGWADSANWQGPPCGMCNGTGVARYTPKDRITRLARCGACNGHGREPT